MRGAARAQRRALVFLRPFLAAAGLVVFAAGFLSAFLGAMVRFGRAGVGQIEHAKSARFAVSRTRSDAGLGQCLRGAPGLGRPPRGSTRPPLAPAFEKRQFASSRVRFLQPQLSQPQPLKMSGRGKGKTAKKAVSRSAKAGLQFPVGRIGAPPSSPPPRHPGVAGELRARVCGAGEPAAAT